VEGFSACGPWTPGGPLLAARGSTSKSRKYSKNAILQRQLSCSCIPVFTKAVSLYRFSSGGLSHHSSCRADIVAADYRCSPSDRYEI